MKSIFLILISIILCFAMQGQSIYLDSTFNLTGILAYNHAGGEDRPAVSLTRPDGRSLQIGFAYFDTRIPAATLATATVVQFDVEGNPDPSFGQGGIVVLNQLKTDASAADAVLLPDGKLLITGKYLNSNSGPHHFVVRLREDGSLDTGFGTGGIAGHPDTDLVIWGSSIAVQPDGKIVMGGTKFTFIPPGSGYFSFALVRFLPDGLVDSSFGENGVAERLALNGDVLAIAFGTDSTIYAGGIINSSSLLMRFLYNGTPDASFGQDGVVFLPDPWGVSELLVQPDGRVIVGGAKKGADHRGFVRRLLPDGSIDYTFEDPGITNWAQLIGLAEGPDRRIVVGMFDYLELRIFAYLPDGQRDTSFDKTLPLPPDYYFYTGLSLQADGKIVVGGRREDDFLFHDFCLFRLTEMLEADSSFGKNGFALQNFGTSHSCLTSVFVDNQNRIIAGGDATYVDRTTIINLPTVHSAGFVSRFQPDGTLDNTFSRNGFVALPDDPAKLNLFTLQPDGKIIAAGASTVTFSYSNFGAARLLPNGNIDKLFGPYSNGFTEKILDSDIYEAYISAVAIAPDDAIIVIGQVLDAEDKQRIALVRFDAYGWPDPLFGTDGLLYFEGIPGNFQLNAGLVQPDGKILVAGTYPSPVPNIFLVRFLPDGVLDNTFGANGIALKPLSGVTYRLNALALQSDGRILLCGNQGTSNTNLVVGRLNPDGTPDHTFSDDGVTVINNAVSENGYALATQTDGKMVVAGLSGSSIAAVNSNPMLVRLLPNGVPDSSFAGTGYLVTDLPGDNRLKALAIQPDGSYLGAGYSNNDYLMIRYLSKLNVGLLDEPALQAEMLVYPNPLQGRATFTYILAAPSRVSLELFDLQGKCCHRFLQQESRPTGAHTELLYFPPTLMPGVYTLRVQTEKGMRSVKVVVQ